MSLNKRDIFRNSLKRLMTTSKKAETFDEVDLQSFLTLLNDQWTKFDQAQTEVECACGDDLLVTEEAQRVQGEEWYRVALANFSRQKLKLQKLSESKSFKTSTTHQAEVKLPRMDLPRFTGNPSEWKQFHDSFSSLIHYEASLTDSQKLYYLRHSLEGEALRVIKAFRITNENYKEAWELLAKRYNVERVIVDAHFRALFSLPKLTSESPVAIRSLLDNTQEHFRSLKTLGRPVTNWDDWLVHLTVSKLDPETHRYWELSQTDDKVSTFEQLIDFLETRCRCLDAIDVHKPAAHSSAPSTKPKGKTVTALSVVKNDSRCYFCNGKHIIYACDSFLALPVQNRAAAVKEKSLCSNCLSNKHSVDKCRSTRTCRVCQSHHHSLLHFDKMQAPAAADNYPTSNLTNTKHQILLGTAIAKVKDGSGRSQMVRILFDNASHLTFITQACVERLQLKIMPSTTTIEGIGAIPAGRSRGVVQFALFSTDNKFTDTVQANILPKITSDLPPKRIQKDLWPHIDGLNLADPGFNVPDAIDVLLGCDQLGNFLLDGLVRGTENSPIAQRSTLGWVLFGKVVEPDTAFVFSTTIAGNSDGSLTKAVAKFWHLEEFPDKKYLTDEEKICEELFATTHLRQNDGRYVVKLPFKPDIPLGSSRDAAVRALSRMERIFAKDQQFHERYVEFMQEFISLGHMEEAKDNPVPGKHYYMPHRAVIKECSSTTKLRVVFNASSKTSTGYSLNDAQLVGPQLQPDLLTTLLRFRSHRFALTADVAKMYRQVRIDEADTNFQRIVWRQTSTEPIKDFRLLTVTYGVASASHLAVKALQQTAFDEHDAFPAASQIVQRDFYMDDLLTGAYDESELQHLQKQIGCLLSRGGFQLRKWSSNSAAILESIPAEDREVKSTLSLDLSESESVKALGLQWQPSSDTLAYDVQVYDINTFNLTKRMLLSDTAKLFDPLGLLSPSTVIPKIMFQQLWRPKVDWDEAAPQFIKSKWLQYRQNLPSLTSIKVPRWIGIGEPSSVTDLHGFADASQSAYAAVVYARTITSNGSVTVRLITAKTRVAPIKPISLPRLELCASSLLARLMTHVKNALQLSTFRLYGWTDSTVAMAWIHQHPSKWCTFVANRVTQIQEVIPPENWIHVPSAQNPADCASRGMSPQNLKDFNLWWEGPKWLSQSEKAWPPQQLFITAIDQKCSLVSVNIPSRSEPLQIWDLIDRYSSLIKLKYVTAFIFRFINNVRSSGKVRNPVSPQVTKSIKYPSQKELQGALDYWIRVTQRYFFENDILRLQAKKPLKRQSKLLKLYPFLDDGGLLRVGGRLNNAALHMDRKHPILLPAAARLTTLICQDVHNMSLHAGPQTMLAILRGRFWVISGRNLLRKIYNACVKCRRYQRTLQHQLMADLPKPRVESCRPFLRTGVDFAGPFPVRFSKGRGSKTVKGYISIFICMSTGAMHLELSGDLTSSSFIAVFKRFVSRRGQCNELFSDNGTNFVGADKELKRFLNDATRDEQLAKYLINDGTTWRFNPPGAPHMGGYWEAAVKRVKFHLRRTLGDNLLTFEEFSTLLAEIEACVNSRPLCPASSDVNDLQVLTPGHFLIGEPLKTIPEPDITDAKVSLGNRWRLISQLRQHFWKRWNDEYLVQLQQRAKWTKASRNFTIGDLVVLREDNIPPTKWKMGRITNVHAGADGKVRVVSLKTADGVLTRPIVKISPLLTLDSKHGIDD